LPNEFLTHLEELRRRLILVLVVFCVATGVCYFFSQQLVDFFAEPLRRFQGTELYFQKPYEAFLTHIKVAAVAGLFFSSPVLLGQAWLFLAPGLYPDEKKIIFPLILASVLLFVGGAVFAYQAVIPWGLRFLLAFQTESLKPLIGIGPYFSFTLGMLLAFGVLFEFPIVILGLVQLGVVSPETLAKSRKVIILGIFVIAAVLTPSPDPVSQLLLAIPLFLLFEASLWLARRLKKPAKKTS